MKKIFLLLILVTIGYAQSSITLNAPSPGGVPSVNVALVGNRGNATFYYWVVANYLRGQGSGATPAQISIAPNTLDGSNYIRVFWNPAPGALTYDVLRTTTPSLPSPCTCSLATGLTTFTYNNQNNTLSSYTYSPVPPASATLSLNNSSFVLPRLLMNRQMDFYMGPYSVASLPTPNPAQQWRVQIVTDGSTSTDCTVGGGANNVFCADNGGAWIPLGGSGGGGGSGTVTVVGAGSLTSTAIVTGGGSQTIQTPSATTTLDSSGNVATPGSITTGLGGSVAGALQVGQGTTNSVGTTAVTIQAPTSVTSYLWTLPSTVGTSGLLKWSVSGSVATQSTVSSARGISFTIGDPGGSALTAASTTTRYITVPFACTISAYNLAIDAGTITVKFWKIATGTAIPTVANSINTAGVGIASGTAIHSATVSDFSPTSVAANDIIAMNVTAVATAKFVNGVLQCDQ